MSSERSIQMPTGAPRPAPRRAQQVGQPVGPRLQLAVGQRLALPDRGQGLRARVHPRLEELVEQGRRRRTAARGVVPLPQELVALGRGEQASAGERAPPGRRPPRPSRRAKWPHRRAAVGGVEQVGGVLERRRRGRPLLAAAMKAGRNWRVLAGERLGGERRGPAARGAAAARSGARAPPGTAACAPGRAPACSSSTSFSNGRSWWA